jgi:hypothetical protein
MDRHKKINVAISATLITIFDSLMFPSGNWLCILFAIISTLGWVFLLILSL